MKELILIAKYMGKTVYPIKINAVNRRGWKWSYNWKGENCDYHEWELKYDTSWEMLMPVIIKISNEKFDDGCYVFPRSFGQINQETGEYMFRFNRYGLFQSKELITAAFNAVCDYLSHKKQ